MEGAAVPTTATSGDVYSRILNLVRERMQQPPTRIDRVRPLPDIAPEKSSKYFNSKGAADLHRLLSDTNTNEKEIRFGVFQKDGKFFTNVEKEQYYNLLNSLDRFGKPTEGDTNVAILTPVDSPDAVPFRIIYGEKTRVETKLKYDVINLPDIGVRIAGASEVSVNPQEMKTTKFSNEVTIRWRYRSTYQIDQFPKFVFDLTSVKSAKITHKKFKDVVSSLRETIENYNTNDLETSYEVEVELENVDNIPSVQEVEQVIDFVLSSMQGTNVSNIIYNKGKKGLVQTFNNLFNFSDKNQMILCPFAQNKPVNLKLTDILARGTSYATTVKLDGVRKMLLLVDQVAYLLAPPFGFVRLGPIVGKKSDAPQQVPMPTVGEFSDLKNKTLQELVKMMNNYGLNITKKMTKAELVRRIYDYEQKQETENLLEKMVKMNVVKQTDVDVKNLGICICDGEMYGNEYHMFDILYYNGKDARSKPFLERYGYFTNIANSVQIEADISLVAKKFNVDATKTLYERIQTAFDQMRDNPKYKYDGIIFQDMYGNYSKEPKKYKPRSDMTIDFKFMTDSRSDRHDNLFSLFVKNGKQAVNFNRMKMVVPDGKFDGSPVNGKILECSFDKDNKPVILRFRNDRDKPNNLKTASDVWKDILNPITEKALLGLDYTIMRKYNNVIKSTILNSCFIKGQNIIDFGSGKGGDLGKWDGMGLGQVFACEPNATNAAELNARYSKMKTSTRVQVVGLPIGERNTLKVLKKTVGDVKISGISAFFCLNFMPKDESTWNRFLKTVSEMVPIGGYFCGIVMNGTATRALLEKNGGKRYVDPQGVLKIVRRGSFTDNPFGNAVEIELKGSATLGKQIEYLFPMDLMIKELREQGFIYEFVDMTKGSYRNLSPSEKVFTSLYSGFIFKRKAPATQHFIVPKENQVMPIDNLQMLYSLGKKGQYVYMGVKNDDQNFIRAVYAATRNVSSTDQDDYLTYKNHYKSFIKGYINQLDKPLKTMIEKKQYISPVNFIDSIMRYFSVNVLVLNSRLDVVEYQVSYNFSNDWIMLLSFDETHFYPILHIKDEENIISQFASSSRIVKTITDVSGLQRAIINSIEGVAVEEEAAEEELGKAIAKFKSLPVVEEQEEGDEEREEMSGGEEEDEMFAE